MPAAVVASPGDYLAAERKTQLLRPNCFYKAGRDELLERDRLQLQFHRSKHIVRAMFPGNGAGKTTTMGVEFDWWAQHNHPYQLDLPKWPIVGVWFSLKFQQWELIRPQLEQRAFTAGWVWNEQKHRYQWPNGSKLYVFSADADWSTAQGIAADLVIFDENPPVKMWREMQMRRRGDKKTRFLIGATATQGLTWMHADVYKPWLDYHQKRGISEDDAMRRQVHPFIWCWPKGGIADNPGMSPEDKIWYEEQVRYGSPAEKAVRTSGGFLDFNATPVFDPAGVERVEKQLRARAKADDVPESPPSGTLEAVPMAKRRFPQRPAEFIFMPTGMEWQGGRITIYEPPRDDANYGMGADMGWGLETSDMSTISVFRREESAAGVRAVQVAEAEGHWALAAFSWLLFAMGWYYHEALLVGERNNGGLDCLRRLYDDLGYIRQWFHKREEFKNPKPSDLIGYTRGTLETDRTMQRLSYFITPYDDAGKQLDPKIQMRSLQATTQLRRYQWRPRTKKMEMAEARDSDLIMSAPPGQHDDLVLSTAYGLMAVTELPRFERTRSSFAPGSAGDVLRHDDILFPEAKEQRGAFSKGRRR